MLRKKENKKYIFPVDSRKRLAACFTKLKKASDFPDNGGYPVPFMKTMGLFDVLFDATEIKSSLFGIPEDQSDWLDELELDKPFPFREC
jgi:hypothetical protein